MEHWTKAPDNVSVVVCTKGKNRVHHASKSVGWLIDTNVYPEGEDHLREAMKLGFEASEGEAPTPDELVTCLVSMVEYAGEQLDKSDIFEATILGTDRIIIFVRRSVLEQYPRFDPIKTYLDQQKAS